MTQKRNRDVLIETAIGNAVELAFALATLLIIRRVMKPDFTVALRMRGAQLVKRTAQAQADRWQHLADNAATAYQKARL